MLCCIFSKVDLLSHIPHSLLVVRDTQHKQLSMTFNNNDCIVYPLSISDFMLTLSFTFLPLWKILSHWNGPENAFRLDG